MPTAVRIVASRARKRLAQYAQALGTVGGPDHRTRAVMFHMGRVGSSVLGTDLLGSHSQIVWSGEIFEEWKKAPTEPPVARLQRRMQGVGTRIHGFEMKLLPHQHLEPMGTTLDEWTETLADLGYTHWISLYRRNLLRRTVSAMRASASGNYFVQDSTKADTRRIRIPVDGDARHAPLLERFRLFDRCYQDFRRLCTDRPLLELIYEDDLLQDPTVGYRRVCRFLNVSPEPVAPKRARTNPFPVQQVISNFDEVAATLEGTEYAWMLET